MKDGFSNGNISHLLNKGGKQGGKLENSLIGTSNSFQNNNLAEKSLWISAQEGGKLLGLTKRTVKWHCQHGHFVTRRVKMNGGLGYEIELNSVLKWLEKSGKIEKRLEILKSFTPSPQTPLQKG